MATPTFDKDMNIIQQLSDEPNDKDGLTAAELKAKFDEGGLAVKNYLNNTLGPHIDSVEGGSDAHAARTDNPHSVTKAQVGLGSVPNVSTNNQTPTYTAASSNANLTSGEKLSVAFGKIAKAVASLISHLADTTSHITAAERTTWNAKQNALTFDNSPTSGSANPVKSGGVYTALAGKANSSHSHAAGDVTSGTLAAARLPDATSSAKGAVKLGASGGAAAYSHTHDTSDIASGTLPLARGGTGQTTAVDAANALITALNTNAATYDVTDNTLIATSSYNGETGIWYRRSAIKLWNYIKGKTDALYAALSHTHAMTDVTGLAAAITYGPAAVASFQGSAEFPLKTCRVAIQPVQAGSGDPSPSNVRAISGHTEATVYRAGKNLFPLTLDEMRASVVDGSWNGNVYTNAGITVTVNTDASGRITGLKLNGTASSTLYLRLTTHLDRYLEAGKSYTLSGCPSGGGSSIYGIYTGSVGQWDDFGSGSTKAYDSAWKTMYIFVRTGVTVSNLMFYPQIEEGTAKTAFAPYMGSVYSSLFPGVVYHGELDVITGVLTVDRRGVELTSSMTWNTYNGGFYVSTASAMADYDIIRGGYSICNRFSKITTESADSTGWFNGTPTPRFHVPGITTVAAWKAWLDNNPVTFVYPITEPLIYQLTPQQVTALLGQNHVWSDAGDVTVEYGEFPGVLQREVDQKAASSHTHAAGDITSGTLAVARGGTGNSTGYVTAGQKSGTTLGSKATAEGQSTTASGAQAHAEGVGATASGDISHAEGQNTTASGKNSHAEGHVTTASGECTHAEGEGTIASGKWQHVFGKYNVEDPAGAIESSGYIEIVGKGTSSSARSNARTLDWSGNETIAGTLTQSSDARLKDVQGEVPDLSGVRAVRFKWNDAKGEHDDRDHLGYLAQEVEQLAPFLVGDDSNGYKSLDYIALLCAKVEWLERRVAELEGR